MTEKEQKNYIRQINAGALPWEIETTGVMMQKKNHSIFKKESGHSASMGQCHPLPKDFMPDPIYIELLMAHHGIPEAFALEQLVDFKLYWLETGESRKAWQSKFKNHVLFQWKRKQSYEAKQQNQCSTVEKITDTSWADDDWLNGLEI